MCARFVFVCGGEREIWYEERWKVLAYVFSKNIYFICSWHFCCLSLSFRRLMDHLKKSKVCNPHRAVSRNWFFSYSLVQWNWFSGVTACTWTSCVQWRQTANFIAPGCMRTPAYACIHALTRTRTCEDTKLFPQIQQKKLRGVLVSFTRLRSHFDFSWHCSCQGCENHQVLCCCCCCLCPFLRIHWNRCASAFRLNGIIWREAVYSGTWNRTERLLNKKLQGEK